MIELITDRTQRHVDRLNQLRSVGWHRMNASERTEFNGFAKKGAYNYSDLNRVETAVAELSGIYELTLETRTDWGALDLPTVSDMERYLGNVVAIRDAALAFNSELKFPDLPDSMTKLTWEMANHIEKTLYIAYLNQMRATIRLNFKVVSGNLTYAITVSGVPNENIVSIDLRTVGNTTVSIPKGNYDTVSGHVYEGEIPVPDGYTSYSAMAILEYTDANGDIQTLAAAGAYVEPAMGNLLGTGTLGTMVLGQD